MKLSKAFIIITILLTTSLFNAFAQNAETAKEQILPAKGFAEVWGYLMKGEESYIQKGMPFTDIGFFAGRIADDGTLPDIIEKPDIETRIGHSARIHLIVSLIGNKMLTNFILRPDLPLRGRLIESIVMASADFDGIQIDFESLRYEDRDLYLSFLRSLKTELPAKTIFSVAVPARWWDNLNAFEYEKISSIADRVIIMAYDEHWRTGEPGPIASLSWCQKIVDYATTRIPHHKLIMGLPLYGRAWQKEEHERALKHFQTQDLCRDKKCAVNRTETDDPFFSYTDTVTVDVHYEDTQSLTKKLSTYHDEGINAVAFWRIGQEPKDIWKTVKKLALPNH